MDKRFLESCLASGMSLEAIGREVGRHPSTVSYWLKKHGLNAIGQSQHAPKDAIDQTHLTELVNQGLSIRQIADELGAGYSTVRYWLRKLDLETDRSIRRRESDGARQAGHDKTYLKCPKHGHAPFFKRQEGGYRCARCNTASVSERRRQVKRVLVAEAGGRCRMCGFNGHPAALHFHHLDPATKEFHLGHQGQSRAIARMRAEAEKCVLLCANCHALVESGVEKLSVADR
ncbi:MAG: helix-turn-helix domain-containing protein [Solirubrobacterales bacterium]